MTTIKATKRHPAKSNLFANMRVREATEEESCELRRWLSSSIDVRLKPREPQPVIDWKHEGF